MSRPPRLPRLPRLSRLPRRSRPGSSRTVTTAGLALGLTGSLVLLAGCAQGTGGGTGGDADATYDAGQNLSGQLSIMGFSVSDDVAESRLAVAKDAIAPAKVKLVEGELDIQQFLSAVAAGDPPDLIYADRNEIGTFASRGAIMPLGDCIDGEGIDTGAFRESALEQVTFEGDVYGIPEFNVVQIIQANRELLQQAGLTVEDVNGHSWDSITQASKKMSRTEDGDLTVIGFDSKLPEFLPLWAKANGAELISEDGRTAQLDDPKVLEALKWAVGIYEDQGGFSTVKAFRDSTDFFGEGNQFATGTLGAMPMEQWYVNILNDVSPDAPMAFDTVHTLEGEPIAYASGLAWAIPAGSGNPEAACRFARAMTETDTWVKAARNRKQAREKDGGIFTGLLTGNAEADAKIRAMIEPGDPTWDAAIDAMYEANEHTFAAPANPADNAFETAWQDAVNRVLNGQQEPAEALAQAQEEAQQALDEAWATWDQKEG
jgi:multiple sugar transport system substrate-binding protein